MAFERVRFFDGQRLTTADFETEQNYHISKRRLHNRMLHGFGVVTGLGVSIADAQPDAVMVSPGIALDRLGNEILVEESDCIKIDVDQSPCFLAIRYKETPTDTVPTSDGIEFSRVLEGFELAIVTDNPGADENSPLLTLARLVQQEATWLVDGSYCPDRVGLRISH